MGMNNVTRGVAAWIACFAMLFAALAPSISHALSASRGETWTEICSVGGTKLIKVIDGAVVTADPAEQHASHLKHCPFCAVHADSYALPPGAALSIPLLETADVVPFLFLRSPRPLPVWTGAQPRAPPALA